MEDSVAKKKKSFSGWLNTKFIPVVGKIGNQTHLSIIRDAFALITPLLIAGAVGVFINQIILGNGTISLAYWIANWSNKFLEIKADGSMAFLPAAENTLNAFKSVFGQIWNASLMTMTLYIVFIIGYLLAKRRGQEPAVIGGVVSLATFIVAGAGIASWEFAQKFMGAEGLFSGIIIAFLSAELYIWLQKGNRLAIKMPKNVPPAVGHAFAKLLPVIITTLVFGTISQLLLWAPIEYTVVSDLKGFLKDGSVLGVYRNLDSEYFKLVNINIGTVDNPNIIAVLERLSSSELSIIHHVEYLTMTSDNVWSGFRPIVASGFGGAGGEYAQLNTAVQSLTLVTFIFKFFTYPFMTAAENPNVGLGLALVYILFVSIFWFFGLHGTNIMNGIFSPVWLYATAQNTFAFNNNLKLPYLFSAGFFDGFIFLGGWGMSLGLLLMTLLIGRDKQAREISKVSIAPGLFNINEPVTFAYPLILNPVMAIPSIIGPMLIVIWTWFWMITGVVPYAALIVPWVAPVGIGAYITTGSWQGILLALSNLILMAILYIPFILIANTIAKHNHADAHLGYIGRVQFLFTGRNYQEEESIILRLKQKDEIKNASSAQQIIAYKKEHKAQWKALRVVIVKKYHDARVEKHIAKKQAKVKKT